MFRRLSEGLFQHLRKFIIRADILFLLFYSGLEDLEGRTMLAERLLKPQCSPYYPITFWLREITYMGLYTNLHRAAWEPSSVKSQSASNQGPRTLLERSVFNLPRVAETRKQGTCDM
jgi:hypothetical protein